MHPEEIKDCKGTTCRPPYTMLVPVLSSYVCDHAASLRISAAPWELTQAAFIFWSQQTDWTPLISGKHLLLTHNHLCGLYVWNANAGVCQTSRHSVRKEDWRAGKYQWLHVPQWIWKIIPTLVHYSTTKPPLHTYFAAESVLTTCLISGTQMIQQALT